MKETIFFIHGMWMGGWAWKNLVGYFRKKGYQCITPTLPYHDVDPKAKPPAQLGKASLLEYAAYLEKQIKKLKKPPIIIGHSMGGLLSQILASRGLGKATVVLTPAPGHGVICINKWSVFRSFTSALFTWKFWETPQRHLPQDAVYAMMHLMDEKTQKEVYNQFVHESGRALFEIGFWFLDRKKAAYYDRKKNVNPLLVLAGKEDRLTPASVVKKTVKQFKKKKNLTYKVYPNHAHMLMFEKGWDKIAADIDSWIRKNV